MGTQLLKGGHPIAKPYPQVNIGIGFKNGWIDCPHPTDCSITQQDRVVPTIYLSAYKSSGLRT